MVEIEKAILRSELGITPINNGEVVRTFATPDRGNRRDLAKQARGEAENSRVSIRNIRRDAIADIRELVKEKEASEDDARRGESAFKSSLTGVSPKLTIPWRKNQN